ncbi:hypothetical protein Sjap_003070 [Stephania japonica]|uniref:Serine-threonine protein phosphatase N-terminal domain-containing protein n=1 Tax=Stephania japonica TaxID=461633 RepID=A0AAP0PUQ5_9MAGN
MEHCSSPQTPSTPIRGTGSYAIPTASCTECHQTVSTLLITMSWGTALANYENEKYFQETLQANSEDENYFKDRETVISSLTARSLHSHHKRILRRSNQQIKRKSSIDATNREIIATYKASWTTFKNQQMKRKSSLDTTNHEILATYKASGTTFKTLQANSEDENYFKVGVNKLKASVSTGFISFDPSRKFIRDATLARFTKTLKCHYTMFNKRKNQQMKRKSSFDATNHEILATYKALGTTFKLKSQTNRRYNRFTLLANLKDEKYFKVGVNKFKASDLTVFNSFNPSQKVHKKSQTNQRYNRFVTRRDSFLLFRPQCQKTRLANSVDEMYFKTRFVTVDNNAKRLYWLIRRTKSITRWIGHKAVQLSEGEIWHLSVVSRQIFLSQLVLLELQDPIKLCDSLTPGTNREVRDLDKVEKSRKCNRDTFPGVLGSPWLIVAVCTRPNLSLNIQPTMRNQKASTKPVRDKNPSSATQQVSYMSEPFSPFPPPAVQQD